MDLTPKQEAYLRAQGVDPANVVPYQGQQNETPTPPDLKGAVVYLDSFLDMTNQTLAGDVISMKPESLKFRLYGQDYECSGHYTIMLSTPRQHKNPYFGFGSPETARMFDS